MRRLPRMIELPPGQEAATRLISVHSLDDPFSWVDDKSIDVAVSALVYHYINDRVAFLSGNYRMRRNGGY